MDPHVDSVSQPLPWLEPSTQEWIGLLLDSYAHWMGEELVDRTGNLREQGHRLFHAPFVVASHTNQADPILNYGNQQALRLWEMDWDEFVQTPSRMTAEPASQEERARMLKQAETDGVIRDYHGIRISKTGRRFLVEHATVWNVIDDKGMKRGQGAVFANWTPLPPP